MLQSMGSEKVRHDSVNDLKNGFGFLYNQNIIPGFLVGSVLKNPPASAGDRGSISAPGRFHVPWSTTCYVSQLSLCIKTTEPMCPKAHALQRRTFCSEKPMHCSQRASPCLLQ